MKPSKGLEVISASKKTEKYDEYKIQDAARTLKEAEKIKQDPELLELALKEVAKEGKAISSLAELKSVASKKIADAGNKDEEVDSEEEAE